MDDPALITAARALIAEAFVQQARETARTASGWLVVSRDEETGSLDITGPYAEPEQALGDAARAHVEVNRGLGADEQGWTHTVWPLFPPRRTV